MNNVTLNPNKIKTKRIFDKNLAQALLDKGCKLIKMENHREIANWLIFHFADTSYFRTQLNLITAEIHTTWKHKQNKPDEHSK